MMGFCTRAGLLTAFACLLFSPAVAQIDCVDYSGAIIPIGSTNDVTSNALVLDGQYIYQGGVAYTDTSGVPHAAALTVLDISSPEQPMVVGAVPLLNSGGSPVTEGVLSLNRNGTHLYAACGADGLLIIDVSNPTNPVQQGILTTTTIMTEVKIIGSVAAVIEEDASLTGTQLTTVDVSDPNLPVRLGESSNMLADGFEILPVGSAMAYVATSDNGIYVFDLSTLAAPSVITLFAPFGGMAGPPLGLFLEGQTLTVGMGNVAVEFDVSNPGNPVESAMLVLTAANRIMKVAGRLVSSSNGFLAIGDYGLVDAPVTGEWLGLPSAGTDGMAVATATHLYRSGVGVGLQIYRANNWLVPRVVAATGTEGFGDHLFLDGNLAYCAARTDTAGRLEIIDVTDPIVPVLTGSVALPSPANDVGRTSTAVCLAMGSAGLWIMDATDPVAPVHTGTATATGPIRRVVGQGALAYCAANLGGVLVVDTSNPGVPQIVTAISLPGATVALAVDGDRLYTVNKAGRLTVLDISNPAVPVELGAVVTGREFTAVTAYAGFLLTGDTEGVSAIDATDPAAILETSRVDLPSPDGPDFTGVLDISTAASFAYVGQVDNRLVVLDVSDPAAVVQVGTGLPVITYARGVAARADAVFVFGSNFAVMAPQCAAISAVLVEPVPSGSLRFAGARPNPFNPRTTLVFELAAGGHAEVEVYDLAGRRVTRLADRIFSVGRHEVVWNGRDEAGRSVSSGVYLARITTAGEVVSRPMTLIR